MWLCLFLFSKYIWLDSVYLTYSTPFQSPYFEIKLTIPPQLLSFSTNRSRGGILECQISDFISSINGTLSCKLENNDIWDAYFYLTVDCEKDRVIFNRNQEMKYWIESNSNNFQVYAPVSQMNKSNDIINYCQSWTFFHFSHRLAPSIDFIVFCSLLVRFNENNSIIFCSHFSNF